MRLFHYAVLTIGAQLFIVGGGRILQMPSWSYAISFTLALIFAMRLTREHEPTVMIPFAASGALFAIGDAGVNIAAGVLLAMCALIGLANAKAEKVIPSYGVLVWWALASTCCFLAPFLIIRNAPGIIIALVGIVIYFPAILIPYLRIRQKRPETKG